MKISNHLVAALTALAFTGASAQTGTGSQAPQPFSGVTFVAQPTQPAESSRFDLDFAGGTPRELVAAIQKALKRPLNAIVPDEYADTKLPALKMSGVTASQLFMALEQASRRQESVQYGAGYSMFNTSCGFRATGPVSDDTIWYFYVDKPTRLPASAARKVCRFYSLAPYLDRQLTVDDITTAIETAWKMLGEAAPPEIKFHKDTKLLIAVGDPGKLETIDAALAALEVPKPAAAASGQKSSEPKDRR